jgi:hypothetical protein
MGMRASVRACVCVCVCVCCYVHWTYFQVLHNGVPIEGTLMAPADSTITGLTYRVIDEFTGEEIDPEEVWFKERGSGLQFDGWGVSFKQGQRRSIADILSKKLPDIKVRHIIGGLYLRLLRA